MSPMIGRLAVLGAGSWGTAYAKVLADAGRDVTLFARREPLARAMAADRVNAEYLPGITLPDRIAVTADLDEALDGVDAVVLAIPSQSLRENLGIMRSAMPPSGPVVSLAKGIEIGTGLRMSQIIEQVGRVDAERIVVLSGPNLAREIAEGQPTATVLASRSTAAATAVAEASASGYFRPFTITDVVGAEIAGTGKNVIALAVGLADGLSFGGNTAASIVTRGLAELTRLGVALGAEQATFAGLAGLGDLVATCSSPLSRNRSLGRRLGTGMAFDDAVAAGAGQVAEGVSSCRSLRDLAGHHGVPMPIIDGVYRVCYQHVPPQEMIRALMDAPFAAEWAE
jgi:glycerol-3-phosphate dehydrogenase (NAD(P)+)